MTRELDAEVAEKVMGWKSAMGFSPSTSISDAWLVVEEMGKRGYFTLLAEQYMSMPWWCRFAKEPGDGGDKYADTAPEAICRAALEAVGTVSAE